MKQTLATLAAAVCFSLAALLVCVFVWPLPYRVAPLAPTLEPGCVGDFQTGLLVCTYTFGDGTWLMKRGY